MRITIIASGSCGAIEPYIALGKGGGPLPRHPKRQDASLVIRRGGPCAVDLLSMTNESFAMKRSVTYDV
jgi:hypothetical protein